MLTLRFFFNFILFNYLCCCFFLSHKTCIVWCENYCNVERTFTEFTVKRYIFWLFCDRGICTFTNDLSFQNYFRLFFLLIFIDCILIGHSEPSSTCTDIIYNHPYLSIYTVPIYIYKSVQLYCSQNYFRVRIFFSTKTLSKSTGCLILLCKLKKKRLKGQSW